MTRVLVVEDEESFSDALSYMLRREGYEVDVAATGPEALTSFERSGADLVLLDLMLPGLSGTEVCRELRSRSHVPIIMVTAAGIAIGGALVLCAAIVGAAIVLKPAPPPPAPPPVAVAPPALVPTQAAAPVITATPPATGTAEEPAPSAKGAVHKVGGGGFVAPKKPSGAATPDAPAAAAPKPAVKHSTCGCAPSDLMCNMQCSAK